MLGPMRWHGVSVKIGLELVCVCVGVCVCVVTSVFGKITKNKEMFLVSFQLHVGHHND